jgi:hypothetical protein
MKLSVVRGGGIAGMTTRTELSSESLPPADARALEQKVAGSGLLDMPSEPAPRAATPDEFQYELTVDHDAGSHTVRVPEGDLPDGVRSLIEWAEEKQR